MSLKYKDFIKTIDLFEKALLLPNIYGAVDVLKV